ncbi:MAG: tetratricopeptide repeat protein [Spirochaetota bacterium]
MTHQNNNPTRHIVYISVPEELKSQAEAVHLDPDRKLPVELPNGPTSEALQSLSWEMILSAMLKILAYEPGHPDGDYYRTFIRAVRPEIINELTETGVLKARNGDFALAEELFLALNGLMPNDPVPRLNLALMYEQQSEQSHDAELSETLDERAFALYRELLQSDDAPPEVAMNAGFFHLRKRNYDRAKQLLEQFVAESDDEQKAAEAQRIVDQIDQQNLDDTVFKEAFDFIRLGREHEGIERAQRFLERHPDVWNGWFLIGWAHRRLGEYEAGREAFERALSLGGTSPDTLNELSICLMETGEHEKSLKRLREALEIEPENTKVMCNLGVVYLKQGKPDEAKRYFESVLAYDPDDPVAVEYLAGL